MNTHYPTLLAPETSSKAAEKQPATEDPTHRRLDSSAASLSNGHSNGSSTNGTNGHPLKQSPLPNYILPVFHNSFNPDHIRLNLEIQQFIELFRRPPSSSPPSPSSSNSSITSEPSNGSNGVTHSLAAAHNLYTEVNKLNPDDHAVYMQEMKDVGALLAYTNPETSILKGFLDQRRRIALAEQVNKAILRE